MVPPLVIWLFSSRSTIPVRRPSTSSPTYSNISGIFFVSSGVKLSSASRKAIQSPFAWSMAKFLAAAKSLIHGKKNIFAPISLAISTVRSLLPVSTTICSHMISFPQERARRIFFSSFFTIIHCDMVFFIICYLLFKF